MPSYRYEMDESSTYDEKGIIPLNVICNNCGKILDKISDEALWSTAMEHETECEECLKEELASLSPPII